MPDDKKTENGNAKQTGREYGSDNRQQVPLHYFEGEMRTIGEISRLTQISERTLRYRINVCKMTAEMAVQVSKGEKVVSEPIPRPEFVYFTSPVFGVIPSMQPELDKIYPTIAGGWMSARDMRPGSQQNYVIIRLDSGKKLIVYEGEFQIITEESTKEKMRRLAREEANWKGEG